MIDKAFDTLHKEGPEFLQWHPVHDDRVFEISTGEIFGLKSMTRNGRPEIKCLGESFASVRVAVSSR